MNEELKSLVDSLRAEDASDSKRRKSRRKMLESAKPRYRDEVSQLIASVESWVKGTGIVASVIEKDSPDSEVIGPLIVPWLTLRIGPHSVIFEPQGPRCGGLLGFGAIHVINGELDAGLAPAVIRFKPDDASDARPWLPVCSHRGEVTLNQRGKYETEQYLLTESTLAHMIKHVVNFPVILPRI